ncbi:MAG: TldD/PmbA family protein [FCB group bacterium]|nr:TldD/PmbA family protein [FCB group bacterium]
MKQADLTRHAEEILQRALANGGDLGEIYFEERAGATLGLEDDKVERIVTGTETGAGLRVLEGDRTLYVHSNDVSLAGLLKLADTVAGGANSERAAYSYDFHPERFGTSVKVPPREIPTARKLELVHAANRAARAHDPRIVQVSVRYMDGLRRAVIVNSNGRFVEDLRIQVMFVVQVVASSGSLIQTGYHAVGGTQGFELFDEIDVETIALTAARQACQLLEADPAPAGRMPVVLGSEAGGTMIHEAVGHGLEADHIDKGMSKYRGRLNEQIAVPQITVADDGTVPFKRGTCRVDDEGTPMERTVLIDQGVLVRFMNDLSTSRKLGMDPTGNGRRQSYEYRPVPRMTNTMILPGTDDPAEILASTDSGLYVRKMGGGQVNPLNGDFVFDVSEGYLIRNGKAETPVRGATLIGNGPEALMAIEAVGNDLGFSIGTCGKAGQGVPVSSAQPTIRIKQLTVGGTSQT